MKAVYQDRRDNCFQACLASILELPLDAVPDVMPPFDDAWLVRLIEWLEPRGWTALLITSWEEPHEWDDGIWMIAGGLSPRSEGDEVTMHAVVWKDGKCIHDPWHEGGGIKGRPRDFTVLIPRDPARHFERTRALQEVREISGQRDQSRPVQLHRIHGIACKALKGRADRGTEHS